MERERVARLEAELARARARIEYLEAERRRLAARRPEGAEGVTLAREEAERLYDLLSVSWMDVQEVRPRRSLDLHEALVILERHLT